MRSPKELAGMGASFFLTLVIQWFDLSPTIKPYCLLVAALGFVGFGFAWLSHAPFIIRFRNSKIGSSRPMFIFVGILGALGAMLLWRAIKTPDKPPKVNVPQIVTPSKDGPMLEPKLVVDSVQDDAVRYHYDVTNIGAGTAIDIRFSEKTAAMYSNELMPSPFSQLIPGATMSHGLPIAATFSGANFSSALTIKFRGHAAASEFQSDFKFLVSRASLKAQTYAYTGASHDQTVKGNVPDPTKSLREGFERPEGSIFLVLPEVSSTGLPNTLIVSNNNRRFLFDPAHKTAIFETQTENGRTIRLSFDFGDSKNEMHVVTLIWAPTGGALSIDGKEIRDYDKQGPPL